VTDGKEPHSNLELKDQEIIVTRRRRRRRPFKLSPWTTDFWVEIAIVSAILFAVFLLVEPWDIREGLFTLTQRLLGTFSGTLEGAFSKFLNWFRGLTLSDATAFAILLVVAVLAMWRARWRMVRNRNLWSTHCPQCNSTDIRRIHRRWLGCEFTRKVITGRLLCPNRPARLDQPFATTKAMAWSWV